MQRVVVFGRGGAGKSTFCRRLGELTGLPVVELDAVYWSEDLRVLTTEEWATRQAGVVAGDAWILDGDLGPYDVTAPRLARADTVVLLDTHLSRCLVRAVRRGSRRRDFWLWTLRWGAVHRPRILAEIRQHAPAADLVILRSPRAVDRWFRGVVARAT